MNHHLTEEGDMLLEALVITVCVNGYDGCSQSTSAYYQHNKELQRVYKSVEEYGNKLAKKITKDREWLVYAATPMYAIAIRQPAKILVFKGTTLNVDPWKQFVGLQWSY